MTTDLHGIVSQMADELDRCQQLLLDDRRQRHPLADHARAVLAEADGPAVPDSREPASVATQPTDEELLATLNQAVADFPPRHPEAEAMNAVEYPLALELRKARAVLNRYGHQPAPPAEGEVGVLVNMLKGIAYWRRHGKPGKGDPSPFDIRQADRLTRAADLLEQRHPAPVPVLPDDALIIEPAEHTLLVPVAQPVPVAERPPGPKACDGKGRCWVHQPVNYNPEAPTWQLLFHKYASATYGTTHWLPAHALPTPETTND